jgi:uncharacterized RDD family membrane protein YckC
VIRRATLARRLASLGYEALLLAAVILLAGFALTPLVTPGSAAGAALRIPGGVERALLFCAVFVIAGLYFVASWSDGRRTLPMKTWRLRLVDAHGGAPDRARALARYLAAWIGPLAALTGYAALRSRGLGAHVAWLAMLNFAWALVDRDRQFLHDRIAGTRLVGSEWIQK